MRHGKDQDPYSQSIRMSLEFLVRAMRQANSTDPVKVARAMEGARIRGPFGDARQVLCPSSKVFPRARQMQFGSACAGKISARMRGTEAASDRIREA